MGECPTVPLRECVSISVSLLNHHHSPRCLLLSGGIATAATWDNYRKDGRQIIAHTSLALWYSLSSPRCGPRSAVYLSYTVTERIVAGRGWWLVSVFVTALAFISSVGARRCHWSSLATRHNGSLLHVFLSQPTDM